MPSVLVIGPAEQEALDKLRERAAAHPCDMADTLTDRQARRRHMRQMSKQTVYLPEAYAVSFSIETGHPGGRTARHMSMSIDGFAIHGRVPHPAAVWMVAEALGFTGIPNAPPEANLAACDRVWIETLQPAGHAINVAQVIIPTTEESRA